MRIIRMGFILCLAIILIAAAVANRHLVELHILPLSIGNIFGYSTTLMLPLFVVIFLGILIGLLAGYILEYLREHKHRRALSHKKRQIIELQHEIKKLQNDTNDEKAEILALLEK